MLWAKLMGQPIRWHRLARIFVGAALYQPRGYPVRVTTPERTLLDGLLNPEWCGGFVQVLKAWAQARDILDVAEIVDLVERFNIAILRQRAGFVLEELGLTHPRIEQWPALAKRGGSSKLLGGLPFSPTFSERWKLSINAPVDVLHAADA